MLNSTTINFIKTMKSTLMYHKNKIVPRPQKVLSWTLKLENLKNSFERKDANRKSWWVWYKEKELKMEDN